MLLRSLKTVAALVSLCGAGAACAMASPARSAVDCHVTGGEKLPAETGGAPAICEAIKQSAARAAAPAFQVEVRVLGNSRLAARLTTINGKVLPERRFATSDRPLSKGSIMRFANSLVAEVKKAQKSRIA